MNALYTIDEIRAVEQAALAGLPCGTLMQRAGQSAAKLALTLLPAESKNTAILVLAGPGNNGGDALELASVLALSGLQVTILLFADKTKQPPDAINALRKAENSPASLMDEASIKDAQSVLYSRRWSLVVDGLFGIGLKKAIAGDLRELITAVNTLSCPVLALDTPSGLDPDTGAIASETEDGSGIAIRATHTITFIGDKPGLHTLHGRDHAGHVHVANLGIDTCLFTPPRCRLNDLSLFSGCLQKRMHHSHKGSFGNVVIVGGARGMSGAPILAARTALQCGAGRVYAAFLENAPTYDSMQPELMFRTSAGFDFSTAIPVAGPGLGRSSAAAELLKNVLKTNQSLILDADALNLVADNPALQESLIQRSQGTLITPHPLEAARLLGVTSGDVQSDRLNAARRLANRFNATTVLKGSGTVIASPGGETVINPNGNPGLATAGSGDVLSGICGALLAQGWPVWETALGAVWTHGKAADDLIRQGIGPIGLTASELIPSIRACLNKLTENSSN